MIIKLFLLFTFTIFLYSAPLSYGISYVQKFGKIPKGYENNKNIVKIAVSKSGYNLKYASKKLRRNPNVALLAIKNNYYAIKFTPLNKNMDFVLKALKVNYKIAKFIPRKLLDIKLFRMVINSSLPIKTKDNFLKYFVRYKVNFAKKKFFEKLNTEDISYILSSNEIFEYTFNKLTRSINKLENNPFLNKIDNFMYDKANIAVGLKVIYNFAYYKKRDLFRFDTRRKYKFISSLLQRVDGSSLHAGYVAYILDFFISSYEDVEMVAEELKDTQSKYAKIIASLINETASKYSSNLYLQKMHNQLKVDFKYRAKIEKLLVPIKHIPQENLSLGGIKKELNEIVIVYEDGDYDGLATYNYLRNKKLSNGWKKKFIGKDKAILLLYKTNKKTKRIFKKYINNPKDKNSLVKLYKYFQKHNIQPVVYSLRAHSNYNYLLKYFLPKKDRYMILNYGSCATRRDFKKIYSKYPSSFFISNKQKGYKVINESISFILDKALLKNNKYIYFDKVINKTKKLKYKLKKGGTKRIEQHAYFKYYIMPSKFIDDLIPIIEKAMK